MAVVAELIRSEANGTISFGDYTLGAKSKLDNFEHAGDLFQELQLQIWQHLKTVWNLK